MPIINTAGFALYTDPACKAAFNQEQSLSDAGAAIKQLYDEQETKELEYKYFQEVGFGMPGQVNDGQPPIFDTIYSGHDKTLVQANYGLGFKITEKMQIFARLGQIKDLTKGLAQRMKDNDGYLCTRPINLGTLNAGAGGITYGDGQPLFSASHPRLSASLGEAWSNLGTAATLDTTTFRAMRLALFNQISDRGFKLWQMPTFLIISMNLVDKAEALLLSPQDPGSNNNDMSNIFKSNVFGKIIPLVDRWLTSTTGYTMAVSKEDCGLFRMIGKKADLVTSVQNSARVIEKTSTAFSAEGVKSPRGLYHSVGA